MVLSVGMGVAMMGVAGVPQDAAAQTPAAGVARVRGDIAGQWQGTEVLKGKSLRTILVVAKTEKGWAGTVYSIDRTERPFTASSFALNGSTVKFAISAMNVTYEGTLSADGNSMVGSWDEGSGPLPLTLARPDKETAWEIPAPKPPEKAMAADADPAFDVATIKPNPSGNPQLQGINVNGRNFSTRNSSLLDLIGFAYNVQAKQVVNGPDWMDKDRYDIAAVPDQPGSPSVDQLRVMMRKLLADRFAMKFHKETRELPAFVLTIAKGGEKLTPSQASDGTLPGFNMRGSKDGLAIVVHNATMAELCAFLQMLVLDRPVVDQTGLTGRYDFTATFAPDNSLFYGHPPRAPSPDGTDNAPGFFDAMQQQLGLKVSAEKASVEVIALDHIDKPSAN